MINHISIVTSESKNGDNVIALCGVKKRLENLNPDWDTCSGCVSKMLDLHNHTMLMHEHLLGAMEAVAKSLNVNREGYDRLENELDAILKPNPDSKKVLDK